MFRKFCNYLAVITLSMTVAGSAAAAHTNVPTVGGKVKTFLINNDKNQNFYNQYIAGGGKHSYSVKVESGTKMQVKIRSANNLKLKVQSPDGSVKTVSSDRFFEVALKSAGVYVIEIESPLNSLYALEVKKR